MELKAFLYFWLEGYFLAESGSKVATELFPRESNYSGLVSLSLRNAVALAIAE
jgi:hypothetical protein